MAGAELDRRGLLAGSAAGLAAWILGYVFTYLIVAPDVRDSGLNTFIEAVQGEPATVDMVGWVFYNAHLVETVFADVPVLGTTSSSFIGGDAGFTPLLYVVPVGLLLAAGLAMGRLYGTDDAASGAVAGLTVLPGYFVATLAGTVVFAVSIAGATGSPDALAAIVLAGVVYPAICGGVGGALSGILPS